MYFCHQDPITNQFFPDLEPLKLRIYAFNQKLEIVKPKYYTRDSVEMLVSGQI